MFKRGRLLDTLDCASAIDQVVKNILVFGQWIVACGERAIEVWKNDTYEHYTTITPSSSTLSGCVCTLPTFLNKIFVGRKDGNVEIYNVSTGRLVHTLQPYSATVGSVTCLAAAPSLALLTVAYSGGSLVIMDVETEEVMLHLQSRQPEKPITSIAYRADGMGAGDDGRADGVMATASIESGDITLWDLTRAGKVAGILRGAHETSNNVSGSGITGIEFLAGQPLIVSSGLDNSLKSWVFDQNPFSPVPRLLHIRSGHAAPITKLGFLPAASDGSEANGKWLLSAGRDRSLWGFSLRKDGQSTELSQGNVKSKAKKTGTLVDIESHIEDFKCPPITAVACSLNRDGGMGAVGGPIWTNPPPGNAEEASMTGWESVVTAHENDKYARTWSWGRKRAGRWAFETSDHQPVTSVAITTCGTFALVGSQGGSVDMHNLQSGVHRQRFPPRLKPSQAKLIKQKQANGEQTTIQRGHTAAVTGIVVDNMNQNVVTTSLDGQVIFWDFISGQNRGRIVLSAPAVSVRYNSVSGLMSLACDDLCVRVLDVETKKIVRELYGCVGQIYDHCFSHDGRWVITTSMDSIIRVFDLASGHLIDAFKTNTCTNLAFSSTGEFLATGHAGQTGVNIWNNKSLFIHISSRPINESTDIVDLSDAAEFQSASQLATIDADEQDQGLLESEIDDTVDQLDKSLLTLSLQPQSKWQTLLNLEVIRQRNKPIEPPQKPKAAPFFLGSALTNGLNGEHDANEAESNRATQAEQSKIARLTSLQPVKSGLSSHLDQFSVTNNPEDTIVYMASLAPSAADLEIRSLTTTEMPIFISALTSRLDQRRDFELVNAWMAVFLKLHGEFVSGIAEVRDSVVAFQMEMAREEIRLSRSVGWAKGVVEFLRSSR